MQLQERIVVYELHGSESSDMQYRVRDKIQQRIDCTLLVVCTNHVVLCQVRCRKCAIIIYVWVCIVCSVNGVIVRVSFIWVEREQERHFPFQSFYL